MHELALAESVVRIASEHAQGRTVTKVEVKVGYLRQVVPSALTFAFELVAEGTPVEGAELEIVNVPARLRCWACGDEDDATQFPLSCRRCGDLDVEVIGGEELHVESLELEEALARAT